MGIALAPLDDLADVVAADGRRDDGLNVGHRQAVAGRGQPVDVDVDVAPARQALGQRRRHAGNVLHGGLDLSGEPVDGRQIGARHLDAHRALDARGQHVDAVADRRHPDVRQARHLDRAVQFLDQLVRRHPRRATGRAA